MHDSELAYRDRIEKLCRKALSDQQTKTITQQRVLRYAELWAYAESYEQGERISRDHAERATAESIGERYGFRGGYENPDEARRAAGHGRELGQQIHEKAKSVSWLARDLTDFFEKHRDNLRLNLQYEFYALPDQLRAVIEALDKLAKQTRPQKSPRLVAKFTFTRGPNPPLIPEPSTDRKQPTAREQALIWWHLCIDSYRGKWNDMFALAELWKLTAGKSRSVDNFRRQVLKACADKTGRVKIGDETVIQIMTPPPPTLPE